MEQAIHSIQRRQSRQMVLEDALRFGISEASRRHSVHPGARKSSILPPISNAARENRRKSMHPRLRTKNFAMFQIHDEVLEEERDKDEEKPLKLPKIGPKRQSNGATPRRLPARRISKVNDQRIVEHLRNRLLRQHERRVSVAYEESKAQQEEDEKSIESGDSYDEAIRSLRSQRCRASLSSMNFGSSIASHLDVFHDGVDSVISISRRESTVSITTDETHLVQPPVPREESKLPNPTVKDSVYSKLTSRPSICVSSDTGFTDWVNVGDRPKVMTSHHTNVMTSHLRQSIHDSERSAMMLLQQFNRRASGSILDDACRLMQKSVLSEVPKRNQQNGIVTHQSPSPTPLVGQQSATSSVLRALLRDSRTRLEKGSLTETHLQPDLPIGEVTLFADWTAHVNSAAPSSRESFVSELQTSDDAASAPLTRQNTFSSEVGSLSNAPSPNALGEQVDVSDPCPIQEQNLDPQDRRRIMSRIYHGDVQVPVPMLQRKVCLYLSSSGADSGIERKLIHDTLTSRLRHFCRERALSFEMIDFQFVSSEDSDLPLPLDSRQLLLDRNHITDEVKRNALERAHRESLGPKLMCFFGDSGHQDSIIPARLDVVFVDLILRLIDEEENDLELQILQMSRTSGNNNNNINNSDQRVRNDTASTRHSKSSTGSENCDTTSVTSWNQDWLRKGYFSRQSKTHSETSAMEISSRERSGSNTSGQVTALRAKLRQLQDQKELLSNWYLLDTNSVPAVYRLKPIGSEFKFYASMNPTNQQTELEKRHRERHFWLHVQQRLKNVLLQFTNPDRQGLDQCPEKEILLQWRESYFLPAITQESRLAAARNSPGESCFWFQRRITNLVETPVNEETRFFLPVAEDQDALDHVTIDSLHRLHEEIVDKVGYTNIREYPLLWQQVRSGYSSYADVDASDDAKRGWSLYKERLRLDFYNVSTMQISNAIETWEMEMKDRDYVMEEVYEHVKFAQSLARSFTGREDILRSIQSYVKSPKNNKPLVIYGSSGCGKSAILSKAATLVKTWLEKSSMSAIEDNLSCRIIFRSIGVTGESRHPRLMLESICAQLRSLVTDARQNNVAANSGSESAVSKPDVAKIKQHNDYDFRKLSVRFANLLEKCGSLNQRLVLFFDSLDVIIDEHDARKLHWLPRKLPRNVKVVLSLTEGQGSSSGDREVASKPRSSPVPERDLSNDCFEAMKKRCTIRSEDKQVQINFLRAGSSGQRRQTRKLSIQADAAWKPFSAVAVQQILNVTLRRFRRNLTEEQRSCIEDKCRACACPLAVSLSCYLSAKWRSNDSVEKCAAELPDAGERLEEFVHCVFRHLEENHGRPLVAAFSSFLTLSLHGLTDADLRQLLARDNNVTQWLEKVTHASGQQVKSGKGRREQMKVHSPRTKAQRPDKKAPLRKSVLLGRTNAKGANSEQNWRRVPDLIWQTLLHDMRFFVIESCTDHLMTYKWRHRIFSSVCTTRYLTQKEYSTYYHDLLATYFSNSCSCSLTAHAQDSCQPLYWEKKVDAAIGVDNSQCVAEPVSPVYNLRRLNETCHHYLQCRTLEEIKRDLVCNYEWLLAKIRGTSFESLMENLSSVLAQYNGDQDLKLLAEALHLSRAVIKSDPCQLAAHLIGRVHSIIKKDKPLARLDPRKYPYCRALLAQCRRSSVPVLVPSGTCLVAPGQVLYDLHHGHRDVITAIALTTDGQRVISSSKDKTLKVWELYSGRITATFGDITRHVTSLAVCMGNNYVIVVTSSNKVEVRCLRTFSCLMTLHDSEEKFHASAAGDGQVLLVVISDVSRTMRVYDLEKIRLLHKIDVTPDRVQLRSDQSALVARTSHSNNVIFSFHSSDEAYVYNVKRAKHLHTMKLQASNEHVLITQVEVSREYYVIACQRQYMHLHEMLTFELYDAINYGHVRSIKACPEDVFVDFFINRLGSHVIALCKATNGSEIVVWNIETGKHQHMASQKFHSTKGQCIDLQHCVTFSDVETTMRVHNLAAKIDNRALSRMQVRKQAPGIGQFYPVAGNSTYVVARGTDDGPITVWNITRGRCKGEAVSIERGLQEKNDVIVVKDVQVIVLSDRGITSAKSGSQQVFKTIYIYDLRTKKYTKKLHPVAVTICPEHEYFILGADRLLAVSQDRKCFIMWSLVTGHQILPRIELDFSKYEMIENEVKKKMSEKKWKKKKTEAKTIPAPRNKTRSGGSPCHLSEEDRNRLIDQVMLSGDESTLLCSFYGRHVAVLDVEHHRHIHTLSNKSSMLLLHQAKMTHRGCHLVHTNYDDVAKTSYLTVWSLLQGSVIRRLKNEPLVCGLAVSENASRIVFATEDNFIKIWEPFRRGGHRKIPGYDGLQLRRDKSQLTSMFLMKGATRAVLFADDISLWDLEAGCVISKFTPDVPCCTVALNGQLIVAGLRDTAQVVTLRLMSRDHDVRQFGRATLGDAGGMFGEASERDSESSEDEEILAQG